MHICTYIYPHIYTYPHTYRNGIPSPTETIKHRCTVSCSDQGRDRLQHCHDNSVVLSQQWDGTTCGPHICMTKEYKKAEEPVEHENKAFLQLPTCAE